MKRFYPAPGVQIDHEILGGIPCVAYTHIPLSAVSDFAKAGYSVQQIVVVFPSLSPESIAHALAWQMQPLVKRKQRIADAAPPPRHRHDRLGCVLGDG